MRAANDALPVIWKNSIICCRASQAWLRPQPIEEGAVGCRHESTTRSRLGCRPRDHDRAGRPHPTPGARRLAARRRRRGRARDRTALEAGYRHIDTAQGYGNEATVGAAVRASGIPREEIFVTTKFYPGRDDSEAEAERSVELLGLGPIDLYLVHDPRRDPTLGMARDAARARARPHALDRRQQLRPREDLDELLAVADVPPAVNQIQLNPFAYRRASSRRARSAASRSRPTARSRAGGTSATPRSRASPSAWAARRRR